MSYFWIHDALPTVSNMPAFSLLLPVYFSQIFVRKDFCPFNIFPRILPSVPLSSFCYLSSVFILLHFLRLSSPFHSFIPLHHSPFFLHFPFQSLYPLYPPSSCPVVHTLPLPPPTQPLNVYFLSISLSLCYSYPHWLDTHPHEITGRVDTPHRLFW